MDSDAPFLVRNKRKLVATGIFLGFVVCLLIVFLVTFFVGRSHCDDEKKSGRAAIMEQYAEFYSTPEEIRRRLKVLRREGDRKRLISETRLSRLDTAPFDKYVCYNNANSSTTLGPPRTTEYMRTWTFPEPNVTAIKDETIVHGCCVTRTYWQAVPKGTINGTTVYMVNDPAANKFQFFEVEVCQSFSGCNLPCSCIALQRRARAIVSNDPNGTILVRAAQVAFFGVCKCINRETIIK